MVRCGYAVIAVLALGAVGCRATAAGPRAAKPPMSVAKADTEPAPEPLPALEGPMTLRVGVVSAARPVKFEDANGAHEISTSPAFLEAVRSGLAKVFTEVTVIAPEDARAVDVVVIANIGSEPELRDYLSRTGLVFQDAYGDTLVEIKHPGLARKQGTPGRVELEPAWYGTEPQPIGYEPPDGTAAEKAQRLADVYIGVAGYRLAQDVRTHPAIRKIVAQKRREAEEERKNAIRRADNARAEALQQAENARKEAALVALEVRGDVAERKGDRAAMLQAWTVALQTAPIGSDVDLRVRERYLAALAALGTLPGVPDDAQRRMVRGKVLFQEAKSKADYDAAIDEMLKAIEIAPWWDLAYFNASLALEGAGQFRDGARFLRLYLHAAPNSPDAAAARTRMFEMDFKADRANEPPIRVPGPAVIPTVTPVAIPDATPAVTPRPATNLTAAPVPSALSTIVCRTCRDSVPRTAAVSHQASHTAWSRRWMFGPEVFSIADTETAGIERYFSESSTPRPGEGAPLAGTIKGSTGGAFRMAFLPRRADLGANGPIGSLSGFYRQSTFVYSRPDEGTKVPFVEWGLTADAGWAIVATPLQSPVRATIFGGAGLELDFPQINGLAADYSNDGSHRPYYRASMLLLVNLRAGVIVNERVVLAVALPSVLGDTSHAFSQYDRAPQFQASILFAGGKK